MCLELYQEHNKGMQAQSSLIVSLEAKKKGLRTYPLCLKSRAKQRIFHCRCCQSENIPVTVEGRSIHADKPTVVISGLKLPERSGHKKLATRC